MNKLAALGCLSSLVLLGCSDESSEVDPAPEDGAEVRVVIGPDGGELHGKAGTDLEGVTLVVPAGALSEEVEVWLKPTFDGQPLPALAERVGLQVEVGSEGSLAKPASLTLPFDAGAVSRFGESGEDVKVWVRGGDGWSLVEADATSETDVTIALGAFTTAAAGVKVLAVAPSCGVSCDASAAAHFDKASCADTAACITSIVSPRAAETFDFSVSAKGSFGFVSATSSGIVALGLDPVSKSLAESPELPLSSSARLGSSFSGDNLVFGLGSAGNAIFSGSAKPKLFDVGSGLGAVTTKSGVTLRFARGADGNLKVTNNANGKVVNLPPLPIPSNANIASIDFRIVSPRDPSSIMVIAVNNLIELKLDAAGTTLSETARLALPTELQGVGATQLAGGGDSIIAILIGLRVAITRDFKSFELVDLPFAPSSVAVDSVGRVLIGAAKSPELLMLDAAGLPTGIRLSDAAASSPDFAADIPRAIRATTGGFAVMTQDRNFLTLSPTGG